MVERSNLPSSNVVGMKGFSSWKERCVTSRGDNAEDEDKFGEKQGILYQHQDNLPSLPVPSLEETLKRWYESVEPLARSEEELADARDAMKEMSDQHSHLQSLLVKRQRNNKNWLQEWWNTLVYLQPRDPIVINVSYFFALPTPRKVEPAMIAKLIQSIWSFRQKVVSGSLEPMLIKGKPLCNMPYRYMFHSCRIPKMHQDEYQIYDPSSHSHIVIAIDGQFYSIHLGGDNTPSLDSLENSLQQCFQIHQTSSHSSLDLGYLTTMNRDDWAQARSELLKEAGAGLELLQSAALVLCVENDPSTQTALERAKHYLYGHNNRWFDKSIQLVLNTHNGQMGFIGEHSMADGMPAVTFSNYIQQPHHNNHDTTTSQQQSLQVQPVFTAEMCQSISRNTKLMKYISQAKKDFNKMVNRQDVQVLEFSNYGSNSMKKWGYSPDAFTQMAIQLATFRLFGYQSVPTYESTQVRYFTYGRTETTRSVSKASDKFCHIMNTPNTTMEQKRNALKDAVNSHVKYSRAASEGHGVDRHLLGLSLIESLHKKDELSTTTAPKLFQNPLFVSSKRWRVSTSTLPNAPGFGQVVPDGVGIAYEVKQDSCIFTITSLKQEHSSTCSTLHNLLEEALMEMKHLHSEHGPHSNL